MKRSICLCLILALLLGLLPSFGAAADLSPGDLGWYTDQSNFSGWAVEGEGEAFTVSYDGTNSQRIWKPLMEDTKDFTLTVTVDILAIRGYVELLGTRLELNPSGGNGNQIYSPDYGNWFDAQGQEVAVTVTREKGGDLQVCYRGKGNDVPVTFAKAPADESNQNLVLGVIEAGGSACFRGLSVEKGVLTPEEFGWYTDNGDFSGWTTDGTGSALTVRYDGSGARRVWKPILSDPLNFSLSLRVTVLSVRAYVQLLGLTLELNPSGGNGNQIYSPDYGNWFDARGQEVAVTLSRVAGGDLTVTYTGKENATPVTFTRTPTDGSNANLVLGVMDTDAAVVFSDLTLKDTAAPVFYKNTLSLQSRIAFQLTVKNEALAAYDSWYVTFERYDHLQGSTLTETVTGEAYGASYQLFTYPVSSYQMADPITATVWGIKDGVCCKGETMTQSVAGFVLARLPAAAETDTAMAALYADLLTYGARAQVYMDYNTGALADANLGDYASYVTAEAPAAVDLSAQTNKGLTGAVRDKLALGIAASVQLQLRIVLDSAYDVNGVYGLLTYERSGEIITQRIEGADFTASGSKYILIFDGLTAVDGRAPVHITVHDTATDEAISETWTYAISSYLAGGSLEGEALATMRALLNYYDAAAAVFAPDDYLQAALSAQEDLYANFWDEENGHLYTTYHGYVGAETQDMIWDHGIAIFDMYTLWHALPEGSEEKLALEEKFRGEWEFLKDSFTYEQMTGNFGAAPNIAIDDTGWDAMVYLIMYHVLGEAECLTLARDCVRNAYDHFKDGQVGSGLWYTAKGGEDSADRFKSMSYVGVMYAALEYTLASGDDSLLADTLALYAWTEENMLRSGTKTYENALADGRSVTVIADDMLYWMDYNVQRTGRTIVNGPDGALIPDQVEEASSVSCLFANMAMGAIHADLYALTGEEQYLNNALRTVRALNDSELYNNNGAYVNDRDAWANAMFVGPWVRQVLTLPGVTQADYDRIFTTADHILQNARTEEGYYKGGWSGGTAWDAYSDPAQIMTTATTVNMITAAALLERLLAQQ